MTPDQANIERQLLHEIESSIEDMKIPNAIAAHADKCAGKPVTVKDAEQLEAQLGIPVRVTKRYDMTQIAWAVGAPPNPWSDERSILIAHGDTNIRWPSGAELRQKEPAYFSARDERNAQRRALLAEHVETVAACYGDGPPPSKSQIEKAAFAIHLLIETRAALKALTDYGKPLYVISSAIDRLVEDK